MNVVVEVEDQTANCPTTGQIRDCMVTKVMPMNTLGGVQSKQHLDFEMQLFPKKCGTVGLGGIAIYDSIGGKRY